MKKQIKIILPIFAVVTVITIVAAIVMLKAVSGSDLFYINSTLGRVYAVSYRWVCLAGVVFAAVWVWLVAKNGKRMVDKFLKFAFGKEEAGQASEDGRGAKAVGQTETASEDGEAVKAAGQTETASSGDGRGGTKVPEQAAVEVEGSENDKENL